MVLCALVPLGVFFLCYHTFGFSFNAAAIVCVVTGIVSMVALLPLTAIIHGVFVRRGKPSDGTFVHSTDAGCSTLIILVLFLIMFPVFEKAREKANKRHKANAIHQQAKQMR